MKQSGSDRASEAWAAGWRPALLLGLLFAAWWFVTTHGLVRRYLLPSPQEVCLALFTDRTLLLKHSCATLVETLAGFAIAVIFGIFTSVLIVLSSTVEKTLYPLLLFAQVIPKISIAPLLVVWLGTGIEPKILVAVLIAFFPVVISGVTGLRSVDPELLDLAATMGSSRLKEFTKIRLPASLPHLFSGLKVAVTLAVVGAVVGEFAGATQGLGYILLTANGNFDSSLQFATLALMSLIGIVLFMLVEAAERLLIPWHSSRRITISVTA